MIPIKNAQIKKILATYIFFLVVYKNDGYKYLVPLLIKVFFLVEKTLLEMWRKTRIL